MQILSIDNLPTQKTPHKIEAKQIVDEKYAQVVPLKLEVGESLKRHITHTNVLFYVLEGTGIVEIGDEKKKVSKDMLIVSPDGIPHCWYNESDDILRILVIKAPKPINTTTLL